MLRNQAKKLIILIVYFTVFLIFAFFFYTLFWPKDKGTCSDGIKNQNEEAVDCGGVCERCAFQPKFDLKTLSAGVLESGTANKFDLYGEVENPNSDFGAGKFDYSFILKDSDGKTIATKTGTGFIFPGEKKYLVENNFESAAKPEKTELEIRNPEWIEFTNYEKPQLKIINKNYNKLVSGSGFSEASGILRNETPFEFNAIKIEVILKDSSQQVIAANSTIINSVRSGENREFQVFWPNQFPGEVANMYAQAEVNIFDSESFAKKYINSNEPQLRDYQFR